MSTSREVRDDFIKLCTTNRERHKLNELVLEKSGLPVIIAGAIFNPNSTVRRDFEDKGGLSSRIPLIMDMNVMITRNICVRYGLVNGSMGKIIGILNRNVFVDKDKVDVILVKVPGFNCSRPLISEDPGIVPIFRISPAGNDNVPNGVSNFPITQADAMTIHKS